MEYLKIQLLSQEEAKNQAVFQIMNQQDLSSNKFGPLSNSDLCPICNKLAKYCLRHLGYIQLPFPMFQPLLSPQTIFILEHLCLYCGKLPIKTNNKNEFNTMMKSLKTNTMTICQHCNHQLNNFHINCYEFQKKTQTQIPLFIECTEGQAYHIYKILTGETKGAPSENKVFINPYIIQKFLKIFQCQPEAQFLNFNLQTISGMLTDVILVPPTQIRISNQGGIQKNNNINQVYNIIMKEVQTLQQEQLFEDDLFFKQDISKLLLQLIVACRIILGKESSKNTDLTIKTELMKLLKIKQLDPASPLAQAIGKKGIFRQSITGVRTKNSGRTVAGGAPYNNTDVVEIPKYFAMKLSIYNPVNNTNLSVIRKLILNYPEYPHAQKIFQYINEDQYIQIKLTEQNKEIHAAKIKPGDIILRTLVDNDFCMVNRYPSIREESFSSHLIKITDRKTINFPITVIEKMAADFDGDEMEIWCLSSPSDILEAIMLYSCHRQFISPDFAKNTIGGKADGDMGAGIYNLNKYKFDKDGFISENGKTGQQIIQDIIHETFKDDPLGYKYLTYDDNKIIIKNGTVEKFNEKICSSNSDFLNFLSFYYPTTKVIQMMDKIIFTAYKTNIHCASSVPLVMYMNQQQQKTLKEFQIKTFNSQQKILNDYYTGQLISDENISKDKYLNNQLNLHMGDNDKDQILKMKEIILNNSVQDCYSYQYILSDKALSGVLKMGCCQLGQQFSFGYRIQPEKRYQRRFITQLKFIEDFQYGGYIYNGFINGLLQQDMAAHQLSVRYEMFQRGNATPDTGYLSRRINQGMSNIYAKYNGIIYGESDNIVSFQYGGQGLDPRMSIQIPFTYHLQTKEEIEKKYKKHPRLDEILQYLDDTRKNNMVIKEINPYYKPSEFITIPFLPVVRQITLEQLDQILTSRLTDKMTEDQMQFQIAQSYTFYIYCLFELEVVKQNDFDIVGYYKSCFLNAGEPVGSKSALGASSIFTQLALSAIHTKGASSKITPLIQTTKAYERFQELISSRKFPTVIQFQLFDKLRFEQKYQQEFIQNNQTIDFKQLQPEFNILLSVDKFLGQEKLIKQYNDEIPNMKNLSNYVIQIKINIDHAAYMNLMINQLQDTIFKIDKKLIKEILGYLDKDTLVFHIYLDDIIKINQLTLIKQKIYSMKIGSGILENMFYEQSEDGFVLKANIKNEKDYKSLFNIPFIDHQTIYCNNHQIDYELFGIIRARSTLYNELLNNFAAEDKTKGLQYAHAKLIADVLTFKGKPMEFTRTSYKKNNIVNALELLLFESAPQVLNNTVLSIDQKQQLKTVLNSVLFGTKGECGTHVSDILFSNLITEDNNQLEDSE